MRVVLRNYDLALEVPFAIARGTTSVRPICVAEVEHEGITGYGEASPSAYYGDSPELAAEAITGSGEIIGTDPFAIAAVSEALGERFPASPSGRAAVETALYDLSAKLAGMPLYRMLGLAGKNPPDTSLTVGVEDVGRAEAMIEKLRQYPILKAKAGFGDELALIRLLREKTDATLRVDANEGWTLAEAIDRINAYSREFSVEFFEQPLPKEDLDGYRELKRQTGATIIVDESIVCKEDVLRWAGIVDGINIKLMKCGGIREALELIVVARAAGLRVMLGCMVESSLGITAAAHIAPLVDYCDLDGNLLISNDPFVGVRALGGKIRLPDVPGLGVSPRH
jgi:L-alanine-DL-glutamate epimerase-like enolase superfamily enzyme